MFQLIHPDKLVVDTKYMILRGGDYHSGIFKCSFDNFGTIGFEFDEVYNIDDNEELGILFLTKYEKYYEFISNHPQWNMERRSVNMIVRRIIGDDHFEW